MATKLELDCAMYLFTGVKSYDPESGNGRFPNPNSAKVKSNFAGMFHSQSDGKLWGVMVDELGIAAVTGSLGPRELHIRCLYPKGLNTGYFFVRQGSLTYSLGFLYNDGNGIKRGIAQGRLTRV